MTTSFSLSVFRGADEAPFDPAVVGALVGTEQSIHLGDAAFPATVTGINVGSGGRSVHLSFELAADVTFDPAILSAPPPPSTERRRWFRRSA